MDMDFIISEGKNISENHVSKMGMNNFERDQSVSNPKMLKESIITVVMAIYNGRKYIQKQIKSIMSQTKKVDELILINDCSPERCDDLIELEIKGMDCRVRYIDHEKNVGYAQTFFEALEMAHGDYIFLADQDDIWENNKIERCVNVLEENKEIQCLSSRNIIIDASGQEIKRERIRGKKIKQIKTQKILKQTMLRPGMTLVITREMKKKIEAIDTSEYEAHDRLIEYVASLENGFFILNEWLNRYRIHGENVSGMNLSIFQLRTNLDGRIKQIEKEMRYLNLIRPLCKKNEKTINRYLDYFSTRKKLLKRRNLFIYILSSLRIMYGYSSYKVWFGDLLGIMYSFKE